MRIAMVSEHASPLATTGGVDAGGQNVHVAALAAALVRRGSDVTVFTRREAPGTPTRVLTEDGYTVEHVPAGPAEVLPKDALLPLMPEFGHHLIRRLTTNPVDIVHAHFWMSGLASLMTRPVTGIPVVQTFHALGSVKRHHQGTQDTSPDIRIRCEAEICTSVDHVLATSIDEVFELQRLGMSSDRASVVPCGVNTSSFTPHGTVANRRPGMVRALVVSRLVPRKGIDDVIRALRMAPNVELVIAGGPERSLLHADPEAVRLHEVARSCGVTDRVLFVGGVNHAAVPVLMRSADMVITTPWYEPFGMVALEAMACGVPVIASSVGGLTETVVDGGTGIHVPPRDAGAIALAIRVLADDPELRSRLGEAGRARVTRRYSWDIVARLTLQAYTRTLRMEPMLEGSQVAAR